MNATIAYTPAARRQFAKNAASLLKLADRAKATGNRVNGYTETDLRDFASGFLAKSLPCSTGNAVKIGKTIFAVANLRAAVAYWEGFRAQHDLGASQSPSVTACIDKVLYRISYNGRVWDPVTGAEVAVS